MNANQEKRRVTASSALITEVTGGNGTRRKGNREKSRNPAMYKAMPNAPADHINRKGDTGKKKFIHQHHLSR